MRDEVVGEESVESTGEVGLVRVGGCVACFREGEFDLRDLQRQVMDVRAFYQNCALLLSLRLNQQDVIPLDVDLETRWVDHLEAEVFEVF